jgi:hypothetical protein
MIGKKNIVFGFIYLAITAAVGGVMILGHFDARSAAEANKRVQLGVLQQIVVDDYEVNLEQITPLELAKTNSQAILAISNRINAQKPINTLRSGAHTHGTADALLNIAAGFLLLFLAAPLWLKQAISWMFISGAVLHSGMLFLVSVLGQSWATLLLNGPPGAIGRGLTLAGLVLAGIAAAKWFSSTPVTDGSAHTKAKEPEKSSKSYKPGLQS